MTHLQELGPGDEVGDFVLEAPLGAGSFGTVYRAHYRRDPDAEVGAKVGAKVNAKVDGKAGSNGGAVAVKVSKQGLDRASSRTLVHLQNEVEALAKLRHPSLVHFFAAGFLSDGRMYIAMELIEGTRLDHYLQACGRIDVLEAIRIVGAIAEALAHVHEHNVLHLDLKPSNIIVRDPYEPALKLLDFGVSTLRERWRAGKPQAVGTPPYMAPELLINDEGYPLSAKADLYSMGTVFYELLAGARPFRGPSLWQKLIADPTPIGELVPGLPTPVMGLVHSLLAREPGERPSTAAQVAAQLSELYYVALSGADGGSRAAGNDGRKGDVDVAPSPGPAAAETPQRIDDQAPFVGREAELVKLGSAVTNLSRGQGGAIVVVGAAGMGKSRLLSEVLHRHAGPRHADPRHADPRHTEPHRLLVGYGRSRQLGQLLPYSPVREAVAQLVSAVRAWPEPGRDLMRNQITATMAQDIDDLSALVPEVRLLLTDQRPDQRIEASTGDRVSPFRAAGVERITHALYRLLEALTHHGRVIIAIEDLHWADAGSLEVLARLRAQLTDLPVLMLLTSRERDSLPDAVEAAAAGSAAENAAPEALDAPDAPDGGVAVLELAPLTEGDNIALMQAVSADDPDHADPALLEELQRSVPLLRTGNPLCTTRVMYNLELEGYLTRDDGGRLTLAKPIDQSYVPPDSVSMVLERILHHLPEKACEVLSVAALIGRRFRRSDIAALDLYDEHTVSEALAQAEHHALCRIGTDAAEATGGANAADPGDLCTFAHDTISAQLQSMIEGERLADIHGRIAHRFAQRGASASDLAYHLEHARQPMPAAEAYMQAGMAADRLHAPASARALLQKSFSLLTELAPGARRDELIIHTAHELTRIACLSGDTGGIVDILDRAKAAVPPADNVEATLALESAYARVHYAQGSFPQALAASQTCLAIDTQSPALRAYQCAPANIVGRALSATGKFGPSIAVLDKGCSLARQAEDWVELSHSEGLLGVSRSFTGAFDLARGHMDSADEVARKLGDPVRIMGAYFYYASLGEAACDWQLGLKSSTDLIFFAEKHAISGLYLYLGTMFAGRHQFHLGQLERSRVLLRNALNLAKNMNIRIGLGWTYAFLGDTHFVRRDYAAAGNTYRKGVEHGNVGAMDEYGAPMCLSGLSHLAALDGDEEGCRRHAEESLERLGKVANRATRAMVLQRYSESLEHLGRRTDSGRVGDEHAALARVLEDRVADFWPEIPQDLAAEAIGTASPRAFWQSRTPSTNDLDHPALGRNAAAGSDSGMGSQITPGAIKTATLMDSLSTIEGFVPIF